MTSTLPFSPLTITEINERQRSAAWLAACSLTYGDRYPNVRPFSEDTEDALTDARLAMELHDAGMARTS